MSLKKSAIFGFKWSSISQFGRQITLLITTVVLARLVSPSDFGLIGMATVVTGFITIFKDLGTSAIVIQQQNLSNKLLHSLFWLNVIFGLLATVILLLIAPAIAQLYETPKVIPILRVLAFSFLISSFSILQKAILERKLKFNTIAKIEITATILAAIVAIIAAILDAGVWSLVCQTLVLVSANTIFIWVAVKWKPQMLFDWSEVKAVSNYSLNLTGFSIFNYFVRNTDDFLIGKFLGAKELGYYTLAYRIMLYPLNGISATIGRVMFPILSQMQNDNARFRYAYLRVVSTIALISFPLMFGLWGLAEPFILTVFGTQWNSVILLLIILTPLGLIQSIGTTTGNIYQAKGKTDLMFKWGLLSGILIVPSFIIGIHWGLIGIAASYAITSGIILTYPNFAIPFKLIDLSVGRFLEILWPAFVSSLLMLFAIKGVKFFLPESLAIAWVLGILILVGAFAYLLASWFINREKLLEITNLLRNRI